MVPFVTTSLKGRFLVFSQQLSIGYVRLGDCPAGLESSRGLEIGENLLWKYDETPLTSRNDCTLIILSARPSDFLGFYWRYKVDFFYKDNL